MKKLAILSFLILFTFLGCKKTKTSESGLEGTWTSKVVVADYYSNANAKVFSESEPYDASWSFTSADVTLVVVGAPQTIKSKYSIAVNNNIKTINFAADIGLINQFDITSLAGSTMTFSAVNTDAINLVYFETGLPRLAAKVVYTINFTKK